MFCQHVLESGHHKFEYDETTNGADVFKCACGEEETQYLENHGC